MSGPIKILGSLKHSFHLGGISDMAIFKILISTYLESWPVFKYFEYLS